MGLSFSELVVVAVVFLVLFGPEKLPEIASAIGKLAGELKKSSDSLRREFYNSVYTPGDNLKSQVTDIKQTLLAVKSNVVSDVKQIVAAPPAAPPSAGQPADAEPRPADAPPTQPDKATKEDEHKPN